MRPRKGVWVLSTITMNPASAFPYESEGVTNMSGYQKFDYLGM